MFIEKFEIFKFGMEGFDVIFVVLMENVWYYIKEEEMEFFFELCLLGFDFVGFGFKFVE